MSGKIDIFPKRHAVQMINHGPAAQVALLPGNLQKARSREDHLQTGQAVVDRLDMDGPIGVFVDFVDKKNFAAMLVKGLGEFKQVVGLKVGAVDGNVECAITAAGGVFSDHLEHQRRLARPPGAENPDAAQIPIDGVVEISPPLANGPDEPGPIKGDMNSDGSVNLTDAILALQVNAGMAAYAISGADVNNNGLAEAIYILQTAAEMR
jgi:hypothetical protein